MGTRDLRGKSYGFYRPPYGLCRDCFQQSPKERVLRVKVHSLGLMEQGVFLEAELASEGYRLRV